MQHLKLPYKIILASIIVALLASSVFVMTENYVNAGTFAITFGLTCLAAGLLELFIGLLLLISDAKDWRNGFLLSGAALLLLSGAALLLLSGISCGGGAAFS